jgi:hypothetical protein
MALRKFMRLTIEWLKGSLKEHPANHAREVRN